ncbi:MAG: hypothetical protein JNL83_38720 [Myxococcales bacterium]|nr:hypothetical protein [Myxococcales bacterium]
MKLAIAILLLACTSARAERAEPDEPTISYKRLYVRAGVLHMRAFSDSRELVLSDVHGPASVAVMDGPIAGSGAAIDALTVPAVIAGYTLPILDDRLSLETVLSTPIHIKFRATGTLKDMSIAPEALGIPTGVPALGSELGEADAAPPIVTAVYKHFEGPVQPYVGAGLTVLVTYNARATNPVLTSAGAPRFTIDPAPGLVLQSGIDVKLWKGVHARLDVKYIAFLKARATVEDIEVATPEIPLLEKAEVGKAWTSMWVNPLIVHLGIGVDL